MSNIRCSLLVDGYVRNTEPILKQKIVPKLVNPIVYDYIFDEDNHSTINLRIFIWIALVTKNISFDNEFIEQIKDGVLLCEIANKINAGVCKKFKKSKMAFICRSNIQIFIHGMQKIGVKENKYLFETRDLFDSQNIPKVMEAIYYLATIAPKHGFKGPLITSKEIYNHPKYSEFTEKYNYKTK
eukprot:160897_1